MSANDANVDSEPAKLERDERPSSLVLGFVLNPHEFRSRMLCDYFAKIVFGERIVLFHPHKSHSAGVTLFAFGEEVIVDFP